MPSASGRRDPPGLCGRPSPPRFRRIASWGTQPPDPPGDSHARAVLADAYGHDGSCSGQRRGGTGVATGTTTQCSTLNRSFNLRNRQPSSVTSYLRVLHRRVRVCVRIQTGYGSGWDLVSCLCLFLCPSINKLHCSCLCSPNICFVRQGVWHLNLFVFAERCSGPTLI